MQYIVSQQPQWNKVWICIPYCTCLCIFMYTFYTYGWFIHYLEQSYQLLCYYFCGSGHLRLNWVVCGRRNKMRLTKAKLLLDYKTGVLNSLGSLIN